MKKKRLEIYKIKNVFWRMFFFRLSIFALWILLFAGGLYLLLEFDLNPLLLFLEIVIITFVCLLYWGRFKTNVFLGIFYTIRFDDKYLLKEFIRREKILLNEKGFLKWFEIIPNTRKTEFKQAIFEIEKSKENKSYQATEIYKKEPIKLNPKIRKVIFGLLAVGFVFGIFYIGNLAEKSRQHSRDMIAKHGIEVNSRLIYKYQTISNNTYHYTIFFDFVYNDSLVELKSQSFDFDREDFEKAIIGLKYKALVILDGENKFKHSKILLDKPIPESFANLYDEREDISTKYKSAPDFIKKYGRTGKDLNEIWSKYYK